MKIYKHIAILIIFIISTSCNEEVKTHQHLVTKIALSKKEVAIEKLGKKYFDIWTATQAVNATKNDVENYLNLLTDDVGHMHYPYDKDDSRAFGNKENMRKGMLYYLGLHTEYRATLTSIVVGNNVIIIKFKSYSKGIHPQTKKEISTTKNTVEVLEVENGKISMIRKYRS